MLGTQLMLGTAVTATIVVVALSLLSPISSSVGTVMVAIVGLGVMSDEEPGVHI